MTKIFINSVEFNLDLDNNTLTHTEILDESLENSIEILCDKIFLCKKKRLTLGKYQIITENDTGTCSVCLDSFKKGLYKRTLNCGHLFHKKCVDKWISREKSCPLCRCDPFTPISSVEALDSK